MTSDVTLEDEILLALSGAKKVERENRMVKQGLGRILDRIQNEQSRKDTSNQNGTDRDRAQGN